MTMPRVTIGVPCFCNAKTIARTIASIKSQSFSDFRVVISDDHSEDETYEICRTEAEKDQRFHVVQQKQRLGFLNFGELLKTVDTPYFVWLAGDDWWEAEFLEYTIDALEEHPSAVSALPNCAFVGPTKAKKKPTNHAILGTWRQRAASFLADTNGSRMYGLHRTRALQRAFPTKTMNAYDWYLMLGMLKQGPQIAVNETLMNRERTDWRYYSRLVYELYPPGLFRTYPLLDMTLSAIKAGFVPPAPNVLRRLYRLNIEKRDECAAVMTPELFFRNLVGKRRVHFSENQSELFAFLAHEALTSKTNALSCREAAFAALGWLALSGNTFAKERICQYISEDKN